MEGAIDLTCPSKGVETGVTVCLMFTLNEKSKVKKKKNRNEY